MPQTTTMDGKVAALRLLLEEVELVSQADLAQRWGVTREAVRQLMAVDGAPTAMPIAAQKLYALPEVERHRSLRKQAARGRGGRHK